MLEMHCLGPLQGKNGNGKKYPLGWMNSRSNIYSYTSWEIQYLSDEY